MIAPFISLCCELDSGDHTPFMTKHLPIFVPTARAILNQISTAIWYSFSLPGGSGARHSGQVSDTPFARSSVTHTVQNEWPHGKVVGLSGGSKQIRHTSASNAAVHSRCCWAWAVAART